MFKTRLIHFRSALFSSYYATYAHNKKKLLISEELFYCYEKFDYLFTLNLTSPFSKKLIICSIAATPALLLASEV